MSEDYGLSKMSINPLWTNSIIGLVMMEDFNLSINTQDWSIEYYSDEVEQLILQLPSGLLARYLRLTDLMLEFGPNLGLPHTRAMGKGLFELRVKGTDTKG